MLTDQIVFYRCLSVVGFLTAMSPMKTFLAILLLTCSAVPGVHGEKMTLAGGTAINPADGKIIQNALITIDGGAIQSVGSAAGGVTGNAKTIDCKGKFILPG